MIESAHPPDVAPEIEGRARRCIASGAVLAEAALVRFARAPDGRVVPDIAAKLPGRGAWVHAGRAEIDLAARKNLFARAFKQAARAEPDLADRVEAALARRCLDFLGIARRAGGLAAGDTAVESALRSGQGEILIHASDSAENGRNRLIKLAIGVRGAEPNIVGCFSAAELGMALGRDRVVHALLVQERLALAWAAEIGRLSGFRAIVPSSWPESWRARRLGPTRAGGGDADSARDTHE